MSENNGGGGETEMILVLLFAAFMGVIGYVLWLTYTPEITNIIRHIRLVQMDAATAIAPDGYGVKYEDMRDPIFLKSMEEFFDEAPTEEITARHLAIATDITLRPLRTPLGILILVMAGYILWRGPHTQFKNKYTLETLMGKQAKAFPYIAPMLDFDPTKIPSRAPGDPVPEELPLFAEALAPEEWIAFHHLTPSGTDLDHVVTTKAFAKQLGARWTGWQKQEAWLQVLIAAYALRAVRRRHDSDDMLGRLSLCWNHKKGMNLSRQSGLVGDARKFLRSKQAQTVIKVMNQHAYQTTAVMRILDTARSLGGVCSPGQFVWLRGHDRNLWYALNNLGRQAYHPEALGSMSHYRLEKLTQRPVPKPSMDRAIKSLQDYLSSDLARPIPAVAYKKTKSRHAKKSGIMKPAGA